MLARSAAIEALALALDEAPSFKSLHSGAGLAMCDGGAARQVMMKEMPRWLTHVSSGSLVGLNRSRANTDVVAKIMPIFDEAEDLDELIAADKIGVCAA